jgi:hypothetical protein
MPQELLRITSSMGYVGTRNQHCLPPSAWTALTSREAVRSQELFNAACLHVLSRNHLKKKQCDNSGNPG